MKVFLSWSGERSRLAAEALRNWLPDVIQNIEPWMSAADIDAGARWNRMIEDELSNTQVGILCLTSENQEAPWVLFEAGALAKTISDTLVCPYLIGFAAADLKPGPLTRFQAKEANCNGTWELVLTLNRALKNQALTDDRLRRIFERFWPDLERALADLPQPREDQARRPIEDIVDEILTLVRGLTRRAPAWGEVLAENADDLSREQILRLYIQHLLYSPHHVVPKITWGQAIKDASLQFLFEKPESRSGGDEQSETEVTQPTVDPSGPDLPNA